MIFEIFRQADDWRSREPRGDLPGMACSRAAELPSALEAIGTIAAEPAVGRFLEEIVGRLRAGS